MTRSDAESSQGLILVVVIGLLAVLAILAVFFLKQSRTQKIISQQQVLHAQVKLMAQSGIEDAIAKLRRLYLESSGTLSPKEHRFYGDDQLGSQGAPIFEFGLRPRVSLDHATWPSFAVTDPGTAMPLSLSITEQGDTFSVGWSGSFDGTYLDDGNFYSLNVVDAQSKLNLNDQNPHIGRIIDRLCEVLYYDEDFNRNGSLDLGEDQDSNSGHAHSQNVANNHRWDCIVENWPAAGGTNIGPERPWTEDRDEDGLLDPNEDLNDDTLLQSGDSGRGANLAWDTEGDADPVAGEYYQSKIGTYLAAYVHHVIRGSDFFSAKKLTSWGELDQALLWAQNNPALSGWVAAAGNENDFSDPVLRQQILDQLKPYITLHSWQDTLPMPIGLFVSVDVGGGDHVIYSRLTRSGDIDASFPETPNSEYGFGAGGSLNPVPAQNDVNAAVEVFDIGSEVYALREMLPRTIKMVRRAPININTAPLHLLVALFSDLQGIYCAEEPISSKPAVMDRNENLWQDYFHDSRYEGNHWYRWMTPLYFDDSEQASGANRNNGQFVGIGRIQRSYPLEHQVASKLAYSIECLRRGEEDHNGNGLLDQDLDYTWDNLIGTTAVTFLDEDIDRSTEADKNTGLPISIDDFEDSFRYINDKTAPTYDSTRYPGNLNLVLDAPFSNWQSFDDFIDKILPDERDPEELGGGQWHPHGDINRNGVFDDGGIGNENLNPWNFTLSYPDHDQGYGPQSSGDLTYVQKDVIKSNFNPNLHLNELNPDRLLRRWVDKTDLEVYSTEFCFEPKGIFEIECLARIIDKERQVKARHRIEQNVELYRVYKEDTQKEFLSHSTAPAWNGATHSVAGIFSPNTLHADDTGDLNPTAVTVGHHDPAFANGQSLMSFPDVQRYDRIIDDRNTLESGSYYEGYLGLAATSLKIGSNADGQVGFTDETQDLLYFRDPMAYSAAPSEGLAPMAVSSFFDEGVVLQERGGGTLPMPTDTTKLGPINRNGASVWGTNPLIPGDPYLPLDDLAQYPSRHFADGVYSEAGGVIEFPWEDNNSSMLFDVRQGGGVMFWVKPHFRPAFAEKVRTFFSLAWINPGGGSPPNQTVFDTAGQVPGSAGFSMADFYIADTSLLYQRFTKPDPGQPFELDIPRSKWITTPEGILAPPQSQFDTGLGRASYDYTNEYSGQQKWGLAPFGCYFFPNHHGSFAGWGIRYAHDRQKRGTLADPLIGADTGLARTYDFFAVDHPGDQAGRLNYYGSNRFNPSAGAQGATVGYPTLSESPGEIQDTIPMWESQPANNDKKSPTELRLYGYPTFRRAQEVRGLAFVHEDFDKSRCDYGIFSGDVYFAGRGDPFYAWQRDIAFGKVEKTGRSLGWGCGFTPESFNLSAVTQDSFAGGIFSANLHPKRLEGYVVSSRRYMNRNHAEKPNARFFNMMEAGKWMHIGLYTRLDPQSFIDLGGTIIDVHPGDVIHRKGVLTYDGRENVSITTYDLILYNDTPLEAPWMKNGLDFIPMGTVSNNDSVLALNEMAPGMNNIGAAGDTPKPMDALNTFVSMDHYLEPVSLFYAPDDITQAMHSRITAVATLDGLGQWYPNLTETFPHRRGGYFSQTMGLILKFRRLGFTGLGPNLAFFPAVNIDRRAFSQTTSIDPWDERFWPTVNYSAEVDYLFQMYINGLLVNQGSHRWDSHDLQRTNPTIGLSSPLYNTHFSQGYAEGSLTNSIGIPPNSPYPRNQFFDDPNNRLRFGENAGRFGGSKLDPAIDSSNYPADATFRNIVFTGTRINNPFGPGRAGVNREGIWNAGQFGQWTFDYRPVFEHYFRGAYYPGQGRFISQALDHRCLGLSGVEMTRLQWGRIKANWVTTTPAAWGDFHRFSGIRHTLRKEGQDGSDDDEFSDFPDDSFINNSPDQTKSKNMKQQRNDHGHLPISLGYGRLDSGTSQYGRIGGHDRPIHRAYVIADFVDQLNAFDPDGIERVSERIDHASGGPLRSRDSSINLSGSQVFHYRLELNLDEKNPIRDNKWKDHHYRENNDRELPVLESPFIDDITLTYTVGTKILSHQEEFD